MSQQNIPKIIPLSILLCAFSLTMNFCGGSVIISSDALADERIIEEYLVDTEDTKEEETPPPVKKSVDILLVIDNSGSMAEEQRNLKTAFPSLIRALLTPPIDPETGERTREPLRDLHIGVVSTDLGVGGHPGIRSCGENPDEGDGGILQNEPHGTECNDSYPRYLSYLISEEEEPDETSVNELTQDFGCIAMLGTDGCGFEQPLEAAYKALVENTGSGKPNEGFLRKDSLLVIIFISDEEDCSVEDKSLFDLSSIPYNINLRCYYEKAKLYDVTRYLNGFKSLKQNDDNIILGMIVGVPLNEPKCNGNGDEIADCLSVAEMEERIRPDGEMLEPSCKYPATCEQECQTIAYPPRRFVELAQKFGQNGIVQSICTENYGPPIEKITEKIIEKLSK